jgi:putative spermidine/putrescine transport system substrate-binding protein
MDMHRRRVVSLMGGAAAASMAGRASAQAEPPKPSQIVVNHSGGSMGSAMRKAFFNGYERKYGIRVVETSPVDFGKLRAMVDSGNVEWDLTEIGGQDAIRAGKANLLQPIDARIVDRSKYPATAQNPLVFASSVYTTVIGYRTDNLEYALLADGVPAEKIYPIDFDRAFRKLDQIKRHVNVWWSTGQQPAQLLLDKEVVLATGWNGRFYDIIKKGAPVEIEWSGGALKQGSFAIPRGARNPYWANKMLAEFTVPQQQAVYATEMSYPGLNLEALDHVDPKVKPYLPTAHLDRQFWISDEWYAEHGNRAAELWNAWMLKKT